MGQEQGSHRLVARQGDAERRGRRQATRPGLRQPLPSGALAVRLNRAQRRDNEADASPGDSQTHCVDLRWQLLISGEVVFVGVRGDVTGVLLCR